MEKSIIYTWNKENIEKTPESIGVFILRTTPVNGDIVLIGESLNIKKDLLLKFEDGSLKEVKYFDWYVIENEEKAKDIKEELTKKYHLEELTDL